MILKNIGKKDTTTSLYYDLTFRISWQNLIGIINGIILFDFGKKADEILIGEIAGSEGINKTKELEEANYDIYETAFSKEEKGWISISGYSKTMETNLKFTFWNQLNRCLVEIENEKYLDQKGDHVYDKYVNSIEITGFVDYARHEEREKLKNKKEESHSIDIECFACHKNFQVDYDIPSNQKTFYCKCPNCGAEIKRGNPNYKA